jgi:hypothetical protein
MKKIKSVALRVFGWILCILVAIPVVFYIALVLVNLKDDPLSPEVEKLLNARPVEIDAQSNAYFAWIGVVGPENQDPHVWGQRWYLEALNSDKQAQTGSPPPESALAIEKRNESQKPTEIPCDKVEACLEIVSGNFEAARSSIQKGRLTLERGDMALAYPVYQEPWRPDYSHASVLPFQPQALSQLRATRFALVVAEGRHDVALDLLNLEIVFHTKQMHGSTSLIDKLLAASHLRHRYLLLSQYMQRHPAEAKVRHERIAVMLAALASDVVSLQSCMQSEARLVIDTMLSIKRNKLDMLLLTSVVGDGMLSNSFVSRLSDTLARPLLLTNQTANDAASQYDAWIQLDTLKAEAYRQALTNARNNTFNRNAQIYTFRNPVGNILNNIAPPNFSKYFLRRDDLLALRGLVEFQLKLLQQGITDGDAITEAIKANQESLRHPYDGALPILDKERRRIAYPAAVDEDNARKLPIIQI